MIWGCVTGPSLNKKETGGGILNGWAGSICPRLRPSGHRTLLAERPVMTGNKGGSVAGGVPRSPCSFK